VIEAKIIADSLGPFGDRIITYVLTFPRIVLAEFNTHRALSRNSASSRAIPFRKMVEMVEKNPFIPIRWMKEHTGMQGTEYIDEARADIAKVEWLGARREAIKAATILSRELEVSKQICNRLLEPFMWHTCIATGTEWENFFALRAHPDAEIHIQDLAFKMLEAANASTPKQLKEGDWHIPFGDTFDEGRLYGLYSGRMIGDEPYFSSIQELKLKIATARCARVSYLNFEGKDDYKTDIELYDRLLKAGHMSPFEHCAYVMNSDEYKLFDGWKGNFRGFYQLRHSIPNENKTDERYHRK
jgi:hypothetical protein